MYLKRLDVIGFKSFAEKISLEFEPGMTAIVGPNGCGKSNVSDAIRWVLGEQSAKALRGAKMEDCIFNGTDSHKPLSMAEVSLTLAGCEGKLGTEYDEVTVTRRVLRSGEGQYFINKAPCRLKDIQRLFMDTGVGTNSYSLMEQGRIDLILSSRPEDRRAVFEEASGITKYKADKKEAIRKLDHTEANLLRLNDIIREVKRQITSLQRQAGKAKRYKILQEKLRGIDIFCTRDKLERLEQEINQLETKLVSLNEQDEAVRADLQDIEKNSTEMRATLNAMEKEISKTLDTAVEAKTECDRAQQLIQINQDRIQEIKLLSERDSKDAEVAKQRLQTHQIELEKTNQLLKTSQEAKTRTEQDLEIAATHSSQLEENVEDTRKELENLRTESVDIESKISHRQNELSELDAEERTVVIRRERLAAEKSEIQRSLENFNERKAQMETQLNALRKGTALHEEKRKELTTQQEVLSKKIKETEQTLSSLQAEIAGKKAQCELLTEDTTSEGFSGGAQALLEPNPNDNIDRTHVLGALADHLRADPGYEIPLQTVLRAWLDAVIVTDQNATRNILTQLQQHDKGAARLLYTSQATPPPPPHISTRPYAPLTDHIQCNEAIQPLAHNLLQRVYVVDNLDQIPEPIEPDLIFVTRDGVLMRGNGHAELWSQEAQETNPLSKRHLLQTRQQEIQALDRQAHGKQAERTQYLEERSTIDEVLKATNHAWETSKRDLALQEGEYQVISQEARQTNDRAETVTYELRMLTENETSGSDRRTSILNELESLRTRLANMRATLSSKTDHLRSLEQERSAALSEVTDRRVKHIEAKQKVENLKHQKNHVEARINELNALIQERSSGIHSYTERISALQTEAEEATLRIDPLKEKIEHYNQTLKTAREQREENTQTLENLESEMRKKRSWIDELRTTKSEMDVQLAEERMRHQNSIDRITSEYNITQGQLSRVPEPEWENGEQPDRETLETNVAEIRTKLESMGPVNLVAIEEYNELEERYAFLTQQEDDLVKAKKQLMDMIREINKTTTELFSATFNQVNENFQGMFKQLFGGGTAKLVMVDEEDVLESGIEIIARPPGKKLQTVSLLSGGERTMTAVALLFSLYMVKPSAFCVLDELDAALDDANIGRFVTMLKEFIGKSQFIVITHNRQTIEAADILYGVTMEKRGLSKLVSVKLKHHATEESDIAKESREPVPTG